MSDLLVDLLIEDDRWNGVDLQACADRALASVVGGLGLSDGAYEVSCLACDDARIATLNADFRDKPTPTNVLSWPSVERRPDVAGARPVPAEPGELGDLAIAFETCTHEAQAQGLDVSDHVTHLLVHGMLHLLGYDHETDEDATLMEGLETELLAKMGIADPYGDERV